ncbi:hypothetical protein ACL02S_09415 [Nocardia sp. 004]|uniref:hypothetical protein n=1 Tax=Nocardia sp. 004 TaxID=3385978 RepID=UPI0039A386DC
MAVRQRIPGLDHTVFDAAGGLFTLFRDWLREQFVGLGHETDADALAMHVLTVSQGVATLANAIRDEQFIRREVEHLLTGRHLLRQLPPHP